MQSTMSMSTITIDPPSGVKSQSILSEKVSRALQVRTDTPAMKAALDALSHLASDERGQPSANKSAVLSSTSTIDSRGVRVAIEQDALQQARLLQQELRRLVTTVRDLRNGVAEIATLSHAVTNAIHINVVTAESGSPVLRADAGAVESGAANTTLENVLPGAPDKNYMEQEQKLAALLSEAFVNRNICRKRLEAVNSFLEKFDLSQEDSRLLDLYTFDDVDLTNPMVLTAQPSVSGLAFLRALDRVRRIRRALVQTFGSSAELATNSSLRSAADRRGLGASSALRMMETLAQKQERAYERLYHWLQKSLQLFKGTSSSSSSADAGSYYQQQQQQQQTSDLLDEALQHVFVKRALYTLRHVPAFYSHTLELLANSRRQEETRRFLLALTNGHDGLPPIEMKSHDTVAYVGDMLAFAFKAFSVEAEVAKELIFYEPEDDQSKSTEDATAESINRENATLKESSDNQSNDFLVERPMTAVDMLSISMGGLARPLKSRILQVISTLSRRPDNDDNSGPKRLHEDDDEFEDEGVVTRNRLVHLYEVCGLLLFYEAAINKALLKLQNAEEASPKTRQESADGLVDDPAFTQQTEPNRFVACLHECLMEATAAYEATVRVYCAMLDQLAAMTGESKAALACSMMTMLVDVRLKSPGFSADVVCPVECQNSLSIEWVTESFLKAAMDTCKVLDDTVMLKQLVNTSRKAGMGVLTAESLYEEIERKETALMDQLVAFESAKVLDLCGLGAIVSAFLRWKDVNDDEAQLMAGYTGLSQEEVEASMKEFYSSLYSPPLPSLDTTIKDPVLRKTARATVASSLCDTYADLYSCIMSSGKGGYDDLTFMNYTPEQVKKILSAL